MKFKIYKLFFIIIVFNQCNVKKECRGNKSHQFITLQNNSSKHIIFQRYGYPSNSIDTTLRLIVSPLESNNQFNEGLKPKENYKWFSDRGYCIEVDFENNKKDIFFVFDYDSIKSIPWDTVKKTERGLLKRVLVDFTYLQKKDFIITYP